MRESNPQTLIVTDERHLVDLAETVFDQTWRVDFTAPGFCLLDIAPEIDSHTLRKWMVLLKHRLSEIAASRSREPFVYRWLTRFDQQVTTKFHVDGAPAQSMLVLSYEPSVIKSRMWLADYTRAAFDLGMTPEQYLQEHNPMFRRGEEMLAPYITEIPQLPAGHSRILAINNSTLPFTEERVNTLGVMHKAEIVNPDETQPRIVNSMMLAIGAANEVTPAQEQEFVTSDQVTKKPY